MGLQNMLVGFLIAGLVILSLVGIMGSEFNHYGIISNNSQVQSTYNTINDTIAKTNSNSQIWSNNVLGQGNSSGTSPSTWTVLDRMFNTIYITVANIGVFTTAIFNVGSNVMTTIGVPAWVVSVVISILVIIMVFAIIMLIKPYSGGGSV